MKHIHMRCGLALKLIIGGFAAVSCSTPIRSPAIRFQSSSRPVPEITVVENHGLDAIDAVPIGVSTDPARDDFEKTVVCVNTGDNHPWISIESGDGYCSESIGIQFDLAMRRLDCTVESERDAYPQPPPRWSDVSGSVSVSSWDWTNSNPVIIEYELHGKRGIENHTANGKVILAPPPEARVAQR